MGVCCLDPGPAAPLVKGQSPQSGSTAPPPLLKGQSPQWDFNVAESSGAVVWKRGVWALYWFLLLFSQNSTAYGHSLPYSSVFVLHPSTRQNTTFRSTLIFWCQGTFCIGIPMSDVPLVLVPNFMTKEWVVHKGEHGNQPSEDQ